MTLSTTTFFFILMKMKKKKSKPIKHTKICHPLVICVVIETVTVAGSIELESRDGAQLTFTDSFQDSTNPEYIQLAAELQDGVRKEFKSFCL